MSQQQLHVPRGTLSGLTAKTILRAAGPRPGQTALVIGATSRTGTIIQSLLAEAGVQVIAGATEKVESTTADPVVEALTSHPDVDLLVDLVSFGEPYFITAGATHGTIVSTRAYEPGIPRIGISAEPGDLAALAQPALDERDGPVGDDGVAWPGPPDCRFSEVARLLQ